MLDGNETILQGPATITMVSQHTFPPIPYPVQVPPGHMVQQIVDENGTLRHIILSALNGNGSPPSGSGGGAGGGAGGVTTGQQQTPLHLSSAVNGMSHHPSPLSSAPSTTTTIHSGPVPTSGGPLLAPGSRGSTTSGSSIPGSHSGVTNGGGTSSSNPVVTSATPSVTPFPPPSSPFCCCSCCSCTTFPATGPATIGPIPPPPGSGLTGSTVIPGGGTLGSLGIPGGITGVPGSVIHHNNLLGFPTTTMTQGSGTLLVSSHSHQQHTSSSNSSRSNNRRTGSNSNSNHGPLPSVAGAMSSSTSSRGSYSTSSYSKRNSGASSNPVTSGHGMVVTGPGGHSFLVGNNSSVSNPVMTSSPYQVHHGSGLLSEVMQSTSPSSTYHGHLSSTGSINNNNNNPAMTSSSSTGSVSTIMSKSSSSTTPSKSKQQSSSLLSGQQNMGNYKLLYNHQPFY